MIHFICKGTCGAESKEIAVCDSDDCSMQWEMMQECECVDALHGADVGELISVKDANGVLLKDGDSVTLIKDLTLRGSSRVIKRGTKVNNIKLTDNPEEVDCKISGTAIVLRVEFLKKL